MSKTKMRSDEITKARDYLKERSDYFKEKARGDSLDIKAITERVDSAIKYLSNLGIEDPNMRQVNAYGVFSSYSKSPPEEKIGAKANLLRELGFKERAKRLVQQYWSMLSNKGEGNKLDYDLALHYLGSDKYGEWYSQKNQPFQGPLDKFKSLAEKVEGEFETTPRRALLMAYHAHPKDSEFSGVVLEDVTQYLTERLQDPDYYTDRLRKTTRVNWNFTIREAVKVLTAFYGLGLKKAPERLEFIMDGITKEKWKEAYRLARALQNGREEATVFEPTCHEMEFIEGSVSPFDKWKRIKK